MANYTLSPEPYLHFEYTDGRPVAAGQVFTYLAGTTTVATTYSTSSGTQNTNPIILDAGGNCSVFLAPGSYRYDVYDSVANGGALLAYLSKDNISAVPTGSSDTDIDGIAGTTITAGQVVYLSDGSGALTSGRWYPAKADNAYSSITPVVGFAINDIATGTTGSIRLIGRVTSGLVVTVGFPYYISSATAGVITATAPALARFVGEADSGTSIVATPNPPPSATIDNSINDFRLTLTTGVPVTTADVTAATTVFWTPAGHGNRVTLFDSAGVATIYVSAQISIAVPATTSQMYDVFVFASAGVPTLELLAWTNDNARATAIVLTTTGAYTKSGDLTRRYVGSVRTTTVSGQTEDSTVKRFVYNYYDRVPRTLVQTETTASWAYSVATWRQQRATATNQVELVQGVAESPLDLTVRGTASNNTGGVVLATIGIGEDSTTTPVSAAAVGMAQLDQVGIIRSWSARLMKIPSVGYHKYVSLEAVTATGVTTWEGSNDSAAASQFAVGVGLGGWFDA